MITLDRIIQENFPGKTKKDLSGEANKKIGKILKKSDTEENIIKELVDYLRNGKNIWPNGDFRPPSKGIIVACSRPFDQWELSKVSVEIQKRIYALPKNKVDAIIQIFPKDMNANTRSAVFKEIGIRIGDDGNLYFENGYDITARRSIEDLEVLYKCPSAQSLNSILENAIKTYCGVIKKVENKNKKHRDKIDRKNKNRKEPLPYEEDEKYTNDDGYLIHPPGVNSNIYVNQNMKLEPFDRKKHTFVSLSEEYNSYCLDPNNLLPRGINRTEQLRLEKRQPGYIPEWQRSLLSTKKHRRQRAYGKQKRFDGAVLVIAKEGNDWALIDVRGLLRNAKYRRIASNDITLNQLLELFTKDPVLDPKTNLATFIYKEGVVEVRSQKIVKGKNSRKELLKLTQPDVGGAPKTIGVVSIDLGQTNPIAARFVSVTQKNGELVATTHETYTLPDLYLREIQNYRIACDDLEKSIRNEAIISLSLEQQKEIEAYAQNSNEACKQSLAATGLNVNDLPWQQMSSRTTYISNYILEHELDQKGVYFTPDNKRHDYGWAELLRPKLSKDTNKILNDKIWTIKNSSPGYKKLSTRKKEFAKRCINVLVCKIKELTKCIDIVFVIEDLNVPFFHGSGKRDIGWDNFFKTKRENRWFVQAFHKAISELAEHRGIMVVEVNPNFTSQNCPECGAIYKKNRNGEKFKCLECGYEGNSDVDVATANILNVALTGKSIFKSSDITAPSPTPEPKVKTKARKNNSLKSK